MSTSSRVKESYKLRRKVDNQVLEPLDVGIKTNDIHDSYTSRRGKWVKPDADDDLINLHKTYQSRVRNSENNLGILTVDKSLLTSLKNKKDQEVYTREIQLANYLIDKEIPESQERVFQIYNELKDVPDQQFADDIEQQESLRIMLRDGAIRGKDDHAFILRILEPDYFLPTSPIWDDSQSLILKYMGEIPVSWVLDYYQAVKKASLYNPVKYNYTDQELANYTGAEIIIGTTSFKPQKPWNEKSALWFVNTRLIKMKLDMALRLYPGLRNWWKRQVGDGTTWSYDLSQIPDANFRNAPIFKDWYFKFFILRQNPVTPAQTDGNYLSFLQ